MDSMQRASSVVPGGEFEETRVRDHVRLAADDRHRRRLMLTGEAGTQFLLDLPAPARLQDGDGLVLDDGSIVRVGGRAEPLAEIAAGSPLALVRTAWHLGNRHADLQIVGDRIRIRRDHVLEAMAVGLGATVTLIEASFDPEPAEPPSRPSRAGFKQS
jgi:urease accessory protein